MLLQGVGELFFDVCLKVIPRVVTGLLDVVVGFVVSFVGVVGVLVVLGDVCSRSSKQVMLSPSLWSPHGLNELHLSDWLIYLELLNRNMSPMEFSGRYGVTMRSKPFPPPK